jgi:hypothetical protein
MALPVSGGAFFVPSSQVSAYQKPFRQVYLAMLSAMFYIPRVRLIDNRLEASHGLQNRLSIQSH